ncbi:protein MARD1-like isoform X1 [Canna indica]|uniref:Protein MARD1-like isoform X1 n=1 Tax=Canna indica TaxID=4628 RepID=A0AAQ3Q8I3_9LILI|nr:protein MARD1-like isoform X1 [Canna indica]
MFLRSKVQDIKLRKRSRAISSKAGPMSETHSVTSPTASASLFTSPRLFAAPSSKGTTDPEAAASPTSILETKPFSAIRNPFFFDSNPAKPLFSPTLAPPTTEDPKAIGLGLLDALANDNENSVKRTFMAQQKMVVFGSQLKIQIPPHSSPVELATGNKNSQLASHSPARSMASYVSSSSPVVFAGCLPQSEIELSEEYTCVILHGPNPKTTHIFENCVIESCSNGYVAPVNEMSRCYHDLLGCAANDFLSSCYGCKKKLGPGEDVYMYRGEKAFCSHECRYQEMLFDEGNEKL